MRRRDITAGFGALLLLLSVPGVAGVYYEAVSMTGTGRGSDGGTRMAVNAWVEGNNAKVALTEGGYSGIEEGAWLVSRDGGETVFLVDPREETYMSWDVHGLMGSLGETLGALGGTIQVSFEDATMELLSEQEGPEILGYETVQSTYETSYVLVISIMGSTQRIESEIRQQLWTTGAIDARVDGIWLRRGPPKTGIDELDELVERESAIVTDRFPLKSVVVYTTTSGGQTSTTSSTTEVTNLEERDIDDDIFVIPPGYEQVEPPGINEILQQME